VCIDSPVGFVWVNGGGGKSSSVEVQLYWCQEVAEVCHGVIGGMENNKFCTKRMCRDNKKHKTQKVVLRANQLYIMGTRKDQALLEPCLEASKVTGDIPVETLMELSRPRKQCVEGLFQRRRGLLPTTGAVWRQQREVLRRDRFDISREIKLG
jgi:hypothetical protein